MTEPQRIDREGYARDRAAFQDLVRAAARPFRAQGWTVGRSGMTLRTAGGHYGQVFFQYPATGLLPLQARLFAGAMSPYLMKVVNKLDPAKPPPMQYAAAHAQVVWSVQVDFSPDVDDPPTPLDLSAPVFRHPPVVLGSATAPGWLAAAFAEVAPRVVALCDDRAIRDWLLDETRTGSVHYFDARYAALLTRHLGLTDELPAVLALAERGREESRQRAISMGLPADYRDRQTRYPQDWSHQRFLRFLDETPP